ncbi:ABC-F family ATP-binding cassette domain-containing protein [Alloscardovia omnicolens]|uniref:ABC-F family ATP-binding cassette domain-containing protein n=1 Tax=Alloscardovia omnicolens TaxID=419015 RepID=UPI0006666171|nr:ABC-F family ATP-binding cassette domain-containing protein [Alloscardovia omnicolens]MDK6327714.1 ABC-F family ATP-binding cassette domain-containing protein [Alloscardovia omnicolens]MDK8073958.1 ABC-F family ATP-binding cassette domain-containing protein [Alloscardovia omnicolens]MDK8081692.1 ABC-F family ATP-binding cassette domain-containing protein [Alloscardovia omnicolens]
MPVHDIGLENVSLDFATKTIFRDVTLGVVEGDRIGIVGKNGDGKSTLLRILAGLQPVDSGRVTKRGGLSLGVLNQRDSLDDNATVVQAALEGREEYEWAADASSRAIVETLLLDIPLDTLVGTLSGGQRRRVDLARLLLHDWDILVLDEPTNHLDMPTIHWLAAHLKSRWSANAGALLVVTHDRWFLDEVCTRMWEVHDGIIDPFEGGYSAYMMQRVERERQADVAETKRRNLARKELAWLTRGARARSTKQKFHVKTAQELIADVPEPRNVVELKAMATSRLGKQVVDLIDVTQVYEQREAEQTPQSVSVDITQDSESGAAVTRTVTGKRILDNVTWLIGPGDRFGIVGANGVGKSTLLKIIDGSLVPTAGHVNIGKTVKFAVLSQRLDELEKLGKYRVKEVLSRYKPSYIVDGKETTPGQLMERLGFSAAQLMTPIADLSGGQKRRMQLLLILLDEPNVLIMDEPGNDLDTDMLTVMEDLLDTWPGTLIVVSHDAYLLERVTDHQFAIFDGKIRHLPGGVDDYFALLEGKEIVDNPISGGIVSTGNESVLTSAGVQTQSSHTADDKAARIAKREASKRMSAIERKIAKLQDEQKQLEEQMAAHNPSDFVRLNEINMQVEAVRSHIDELEMEWLEKSEIVEG